MSVFPDAELTVIVLRRIDCQIVGFVRRAIFPADDWEDGAIAYRAFFMRNWVGIYCRILLKYGTHDHAIYMCAHRGLLNELSREALQMVRSALRWDKRKR